MLKNTNYVRTFSTLGCPSLSIADVLALATLHRIPAVELRSLNNSIDLPSSLSGREIPYLTIASDFADAGVQITSLSTSFRLLDGTEADRMDLLRYVPVAEALGVPRLRVFDGGKNGSRAELEQAAKTVNWWLSLKAKHGWKTDLMIETHDALKTSDVIIDLVRTVPSLRILWDTHHTWRIGGEPVSETWNAIQEYVVHIHVKDSIKACSTQPIEYVLPGSGEFPMAALRQAIEKTFCGPLSLEWEKHWHPQLASLEVALLSADICDWW